MKRLNLIALAVMAAGSILGAQAMMGAEAPYTLLSDSGPIAVDIKKALKHFEQLPIYHPLATKYEVLLDTHTKNNYKESL